MEYALVRGLLVSSQQ